MKYLILKFENAKLFRSRKKIGVDPIIDFYDGHKNRKDQKQFKDPITVYQISNILYVLFGERPIPSFRNLWYNKNEYYKVKDSYLKKNKYLFNKAKDSYLKIDTHQSYNETRDEYQYVTELMQTNKPKWNAWNKFSYFNWERITNYLGANFEEFVRILRVDLNIDVSLPLIDILPIINANTKIRKFLSDTRNINLSRDMDLYEKGGGGYLGRKLQTILIRSIESVSKLSGTIIVPVEDIDISKLSECVGCATLLDGGMVYIDKIVNRLTEDKLTGFVPVKNLSIEKY